MSVKDPAKSGANLVVGGVTFAIILWVLFVRNFGGEVSTAIVSGMPVSVQTAVSLKQEKDLAKAAFLSSGNPAALETGTLRGGVVSSMLQIMAVLLDNGLPILINVLSALGAAVIAIFGFAKTFVIDEVAGLLGFTKKAFTKDGELIKKQNQKLYARQEEQVETIESLSARIEAVDAKINEPALRDALRSLRTDVDGLMGGGTIELVESTDKPANVEVADGLPRGGNDEVATLLRQLIEMQSQDGEEVESEPAKKPTRTRTRNTAAKSK